MTIGIQGNDEAPVRIVDIVVGLQTTQTAQLRPSWARAFFANRFKADDAAVSGMEVEDYVGVMDEAGIEHSILFSPKAGPEHEPTSYRPDPRIVATAVERFPDRLSGIIGVDPIRPMTAIAEIDYAVKSMGFIGVHTYPHWFGLAPDDRLWYPIYAKCCELDVPIQIQVGHCLLYTPDKPLRSVGQPISLDRVACDFPELKIIGIHTGWPWVEEMISVATKHPNVFIGIDAYSPKHLSPALVTFMDSWGAGKVLFGTDYPVIDPRRAVEEVNDLGLRETSLRLLLGDTARNLYSLEK